VYGASLHRRDKRITAARARWPTDSLGQQRTLPAVDTKRLPYNGISIPPEAELLICQVREQSMSGDDNALDGHAVFCREKFAYALALLDGRTQMDSDDWKL
jgi:hypothetical protein